MSAAFLAAHTQPRVAAALDLGCGPGHSTALVARTCTPASSTGIDASERFLEVARARVPTARFAAHDVRSLPLPGAPPTSPTPDLVLAHLPDPPAVVTAWRTQLSPGNVLLVEDLEGVEAPRGCLRRYDELSADVVRRGGGVMYAGAALAGLRGRVRNRHRRRRHGCPPCTPSTCATGPPNLLSPRPDTWRSLLESWRRWRATAEAHP